MRGFVRVASCLIVSALLLISPGDLMAEAAPSESLHAPSQELLVKGAAQDLAHIRERIGRIESLGADNMRRIRQVRALLVVAGAGGIVLAIINLLLLAHLLGLWTPRWLQGRQAVLPPSVSEQRQTSASRAEGWLGSRLRRLTRTFESTATRVPVPAPLSLGRLCRNGAIVALNCVLLFAAINLAVVPFLPAVPSADELAEVHADTWRQTYSIELLRSLYPGLPDHEVIEKTRNPHGTGVVYEPFIQVKTEPGIGWPSTGGAGVHEEGFRLIGPKQGPWPPDPSALVIFVFGGSTTVGSGVDDDETIPARLQVQLRERAAGRRIDVYNFGVPGFFSAVERVYFETLLVKGIIPDIAIFIDGYNDFHIWKGEPGMTWWFRKQFVKWYRGEAERSLSWFADALWQRLPAVRLIERLRPKQTLDSYGGPGFDGGGQPLEYYKEPEKIRQVIDRYDTNLRITRAVGDSYGVQTVFVWQPVSTYKYSGELPLGQMGGEGLRTKWGYPEMRKVYDNGSLGETFVWCADIQEGISQGLYVDQAIHYNLQGSDLIARCIADRLARLGIVEVAGTW